MIQIGKRRVNDARVESVDEEQAGSVDRRETAAVRPVPSLADRTPRGNGDLRLVKLPGPTRWAQGISVSIYNPLDSRPAARPSRAMRGLRAWDISWALAWIAFALLVVAMVATTFTDTPITQQALNLSFPGVRLSKPPARIPAAASFSLGSSKNQVLAAQGKPTRSGGNAWYYGNSVIYFKGDWVSGWRDSAENPLKYAAPPAHSVPNQGTASTAQY